MLLLPGRGISRRCEPRTCWRTWVRSSAWPGPRCTAVRSIRRWRPSVVVSVGGYASFPAGLAAVVLRIPLVLVNVDAVPGPGPPACSAGSPRRVRWRSPARRCAVRWYRNARARGDRDRSTARRRLWPPPDGPWDLPDGPRRRSPSSAARSGARRVNEAVAWSLAERWRDAVRPRRLPRHRAPGLGGDVVAHVDPGSGRGDHVGRGAVLPAGALRGPHGARSTERRICASAAPGPSRWPSWPLAGRAGGAGAPARARPATTRPPTPGSSSMPVRPCWSPTTGATAADLEPGGRGAVRRPRRLVARWVPPRAGPRAGPAPPNRVARGRSTVHAR